MEPLELEKIIKGIIPSIDSSIYGGSVTFSLGGLEYPLASCTFAGDVIMVDYVYSRKIQILEQSRKFYDERYGKLRNKYPRLHSKEIDEIRKKRTDLRAQIDLYREIARQFREVVEGIPDLKLKWGDNTQQEVE